MKTEITFLQHVLQIDENQVKALIKEYKEQKPNKDVIYESITVFYDLVSNDQPCECPMCNGSKPHVGKYSFRLKDEFRHLLKSKS